MEEYTELTFKVHNTHSLPAVWESTYIFLGLGLDFSIEMDFMEAFEDL